MSRLCKHPIKSKEKGQIHTPEEEIEETKEYLNKKKLFFEEKQNEHSKQHERERVKNCFCFQVLALFTVFD